MPLSFSFFFSGAIGKLKEGPQSAFMASMRSR
ncbi:hypothetical protein AB4Z52_30200 [Rhizobium sp. 2YAF20]